MQDNFKVNSRLNLELGLRWDRFANGNLPAGERTRTRWFDTTALAVPPRGRFGNSATCILEGPGLHELSITASKNFRLAERFRFALMSAMQNAFNHANFNTPGANISAPGSLGLTTSTHAFAPGRRNLVLMIVDALRAEMPGCAGNRIVLTPHFDALAARGARFQNTFCQHGVCIPNRASTFTGRYPSGHGVWANGVPLRKSGTTLAQAIEERGCATGSAGKHHFEAERAPGYPPRIAPGLQLPGLPGSPSGGEFPPSRVSCVFEE